MNRLSENKVMQNWPNEVLNLAHYSLRHLIALQRALIQLTWNEWVKLRRIKAEKRKIPKYIWRTLENANRLSYYRADPSSHENTERNKAK